MSRILFGKTWRPLTKIEWEFTMKRLAFIFLTGILLAACNMQPHEEDRLEPDTPIEAQANAW
jgi:hypothetical protein